MAFTEELVRLGQELDFVIFEDRKFADIGELNFVERSCDLCQQGPWDLPRGMCILLACHSVRPEKLGAVVAVLIVMTSPRPSQCITHSPTPHSPYAV